MNLYDLFHATADRQPNHPAVLDRKRGSRLSYRELDDAVTGASKILTAAGVQPGDCVGLHVPSSVDYIVWTYAVWRCGGAVVPISMDLAASEKEEVCRCLALDKIITARRGAGIFASMRVADAAAVTNECEVFAMRSVQERPSALCAINPAFIRFSSGTTGAAKGVVLSHETVWERIAAANEALGVGPHDRVLWVLSMAYHFTVSIVAYLTYGATVVLPANHFAAAMVEAADQAEATILYAAPTHYGLLGEFPGARPLPALRLAISTTSALSQQTSAVFRQRYGRAVGQALGIIEVGLPCIDLAPEPARVQSVGPILPAYELRLKDAGFGAEAQEILLRGPGMLDAYYHPWRTRDEVLQDGWFHTGDVGRVDAEGYLYLTGRSKDVINVMGMKFFPHEVERVLASHPDVAAACVFAGRDERWGETVKARVVPNESVQDEQLANRLQAYCRERVAEYKVPRQFEFVAALPRTASGKVLHRAL